MEFNLKELARKKIIIVAHRGIWGGNIPGNTIPAYRTALKQGADMIEIDVDRSADGELFVFHPGKEKVFLGIHTPIREMQAKEIEKLRYLNSSGNESQYGIERLEDVFREFKGKCYINVDKFQDNPEQIADMIRSFGMADQILVKTQPKQEYLEDMQRYCPDIPYISMISDETDIEKILEYDINYVGNEVLFSRDDHVFAQEEFVRRQHEKGYLVWCNAIIYSYKDLFSGGHDDDRSLADDPANGWGWIADKGYDFIQTDWALMVKEYLESTGKLYRC